MNKLLRSPYLIMIGIFLIIALIILTQRSCQSKKSNPKLDDRIIRDSTSQTTKLQLWKIKLEINDVKVTDYSNIAQMPTNEYVKGNKGLYYFIDLKDSASQTVILFPSGEYSFDDNEWAVIKALDNVKASVWTGILKGVKYKIFIEGQADLTGDRTFNRKFLPNYVYDKIEYHPTYKSKSQSRIFYDSTFLLKMFSEPLRNSDLPLLRASYLVDKLSAYGDIPKPVTLEGEVKDKIGADYRNGKIILFIDTATQLDPIR